MQRTGNLHDGILSTHDAESANILDNATAFDTAVDMFNADTQGGELLIKGFLSGGQLAAFGFLERGQTLDAIARESQKAQILEQPTTGRQQIGMRIGNAFVMHAAHIGVGKEQDGQGSIDEQQILQGMRFFLAAIARFLCSRILGTLDASFGGIMAKRGSGASGAGHASSLSGKETPSCAANSLTLRAGANPMWRKVARRTGNKVCNQTFVFP